MYSLSRLKLRLCSNNGKSAFSKRNLNLQLVKNIYAFSSEKHFNLIKVYKGWKYFGISKAVSSNSSPRSSSIAVSSCHTNITRRESMMYVCDVVYDATWPFLPDAGVVRVGENTFKV